MRVDRADGRARVSLRIFLILVILAALVPPLVLLAMAVVRTAQTDRLAAEASLTDDAKVIASMVHGALLSDIEMLRTIGTHVAEANSGAAAELDLINDHFRGNATLVRAPDATFDASWGISNLTNIRAGERASLTYTVPLWETGQLLQLTGDSRKFSNKIGFGRIDNQRLVALVDGNGNIITRSAEALENLGKRVPSWDALLDVGQPTGTVNAIAFDGTPISFGFSSVAGTPGWVAVVGMPKALLDARWQSPFIAFGISVMIAIAMALFLSVILSRRITRPIEAMVARSEAIARDDVLPLPPVPRCAIIELNTLYRAQAQSHTRLTARADELALSSKRYRAVAKVGAMVTWRADMQGNVLEIEGWDEFTGQRSSDALERGWVERVHPDDMPELARTLRRAALPGDATVTSELRVRARDGEWAWVNFRGALITGADGRPAEWIGTLENINDRKRLQLHISHLAYHDPLTGLPNRIRLIEHFEHLWQPGHAGEPCALLYIDLDRFKEANDTFGHGAGDAILRQVARRLQSQLRADDLAARLGGDEFAMVLGNLENADRATLVAGRIVKALSSPFEVDGTVIEIGASVGVALFSAGALSIERLQFEADSALYRAKAGGRNRWAFNHARDEQKRA